MGVSAKAAAMGERRGGEGQHTSHLALADSFALFRMGLRIIISEAEDFEVSEAASLEELVALVSAASRPDLALVDLDLPPSGAKQAVTFLHKNDVLPIVWGRRHRLSSDLVFELVRAGAVGVLPKEISPTGLIRSVRGVLAGEAALGRDTAWLLVNGLQTANATAGSGQDLTTLSSRELEVLELVAHARANKEIAEQLGLSEFTVKRHIQNILRKIGARSRWEASASYLAQRRELGLSPRVPVAVFDADEAPPTERDGFGSGDGERLVPA
jgi:DNA-binding NarL/FixJ family response regulator